MELGHVDGAYAERHEHEEEKWQGGYDDSGYEPVTEAEEYARLHAIYGAGARRGPSRRGPGPARGPPRRSIDDATFKKRMAEGSCLQCGRMGHYGRECPERIGASAPKQKNA